MDNNFNLARENMVKSQLLTNKITNKNVIKAFLSVPKHDFMPENLKAVSYCDEAVKLNDNRSVMSSLVMSRMIQALDIKKSDMVLDIASGIGYSSAILSSLAGRVVAVESDADLMSRANSSLRKFGYDNVIIMSNDLLKGNPDAGPYDAIFVNGALKDAPRSLFEQLKESGKLVMVVDKAPHSGIATLYTKQDGKIMLEELFDIKVDSLDV